MAIAARADAYVQAASHAVASYSSRLHSSNSGTSYVRRTASIPPITVGCRRVRSCTLTRAHTHPHTHTQTHTRTHAHTHTRTHAHTIHTHTRHNAPLTSAGSTRAPCGCGCCCAGVVTGGVRPWPMSWRGSCCCGSHRRSSSSSFKLRCAMRSRSSVSDSLLRSCFTCGGLSACRNGATKRAQATSASAARHWRTASAAVRTSSPRRMRCISLRGCAFVVSISHRAM